MDMKILIGHSSSWWLSWRSDRWPWLLDRKHFFANQGDGYSLLRNQVNGTKRMIHIPGSIRSRPENVVGITVLCPLSRKTLKGKQWNVWFFWHVQKSAVVMLEMAIWEEATNLWEFKCETVSTIYLVKWTENEDQYCWMLSFRIFYFQSLT